MEEILKQLLYELSTPSITDWLMVVVTAVYVLTTVLICVSNYKSAKASNQQIKEMKKQQEQNVAIQLFEKRLNVLEKIENFCKSLYSWEFNLTEFTPISENEIVLLFDYEVYTLYRDIYSLGEKINILHGDLNYATENGNCRGKSDEEIQNEIYDLAVESNEILKKLKIIVISNYLKIKD